MCGRFTLTTSGDVVAEFFQLAEAPKLAPRYNIAPTQPAPVVLLDSQTGRRHLRLFRWGLIPPWAKDSSIGSRMINARAETVATKPAYRSAFRNRRCLIVTNGFYEWQDKPERGRRKQPHYICMNDGQVFAFAGLWERWASPDGSVIDSCTVITTEPNELVKPLHNRMPAILHSSDYDRWLAISGESPTQLQALLGPYPVAEMTAYPVGTQVNNPSFDSPVCIDPLPS